MKLSAFDYDRHSKVTEIGTTSLYLKEIKHLNTSPEGLIMTNFLAQKKQVLVYLHCICSMWFIMMLCIFSGIWRTHVRDELFTHGAKIVFQHYESHKSQIWGNCAQLRQLWWIEALSTFPEKLFRNFACYLFQFHTCASFNWVQAEKWSRKRRRRPVLEPKNRLSTKP